MAHRTDVIQVHKDFPEARSQVEVTDPYCGTKMPQKEARSVIYREHETLYFCSRDCKENFLSIQKHHLKAA